MLRQLSVDNYILIDHLEIAFDAHLNIITGETGAGKSILLGALGLLLGNKNEGTTLRNAEKNCVIEALFDVEPYDMMSFFEENDLDYCAQTVVRRVITPAGKSRAYINDLPVQLAQLRAFGNRLLDIHSQHQNLVLASETFRIEALDAMAEATPLREQYRTVYERVQALQRSYEQAKAELERARKDEEWLRYQVDELLAANLREGERAELEQEQALLSHADLIGSTIASVRNSLDEDERGVLSQVKNAEVELGHLREHYPIADELATRLRSVLEELKDISSTLAQESQHVDMDPARLQQVDDRLNVLYSLCQKYRVAEETELLALRDRYVAELAAITQSDEALLTLEQQIAQARNEAERIARLLHEKRVATAPEMSAQIVAQLVRLGMPDVRFVIDVTESDTLLPLGEDRITYLFSANRTVDVAPVERTASGGELSRVMLSLKALLAGHMQLPTILFDEIDTGVSGRIADAMGEIICNLAESMQVIDITHLPQVASKGETHFVVYKEAGETHITRLTAEQRRVEIAKMLSGSEVTEAAKMQARILLGDD
jgi:DNA repair protein RecN (Recombination protein N)